MADGSFVRLTVDMCNNPNIAPNNQILMCWGNGGWRFMIRDSVGQWRSIIRCPKPAPKLWGYPPEIETTP